MPTYDQRQLSADGTGNQSGGEGGPHAASHAQGGDDPCTFTIAQVTGLQTAIDAKADDSATTSALAGKSATGHNHDAAYSPLGHTHAGGDSRLLTAVGTAGANTTSNTTGISTGIAFTLATGEYVITLALRQTTAATTTAPGFSVAATGGLVAATCELTVDHYITAITAQPSFATALATWTAGTTGCGATVSPTVITIRIRVTTGGTLTLWMRSEVSGSAVTMVEGSGSAIKVA